MEVLNMDFKIQIATEIIRNPTISHEAFYVYAKLLQHYFVKKDGNVELTIDHKKFMYFCNIKSNHTLKKTLTQLYENKLILNEIDKLPRQGTIMITLNDRYVKNGKKFKFAQFEYWILDQCVLDHIKYEGFRLLYYLQSYISKEKQFCHCSRETIASEIGSNPKTVDKYVEILKKWKLIKVVKHELKSSGEYKMNEFGKEKETFTKFNNHYYIRNEKLKEIHTKMKKGC